MTYVGRTPSRSKNLAWRGSSAMFSTVMPVRLRFQLSSSVSSETMSGRGPGARDMLRLHSRAAAQPGAQLPRRIEGAQRASTEPTPKDRDLFRHPIGRGPLTFVGIGATQEVEPAIAPLDRALNHRAHQHETDAVPLPRGIAAALVEVDRITPGEPIPGGDRRARHVQRGQPEFATRRQLD